MVWKPTLVLLRVNRAATFVRWSPNEDKFAVASGARSDWPSSVFRKLSADVFRRAIAVCSFDPENNWWMARQLKKPIRSTVLSVDWHPNNVLLAAGSADMKARVFSAYIKDVDKRLVLHHRATPIMTEICPPGPLRLSGEKNCRSTLCAASMLAPLGGGFMQSAFRLRGMFWRLRVSVISFLSWIFVTVSTGHDSSINIVYPGGPVIQNIRIGTLPYVTLTWTSEDSIVAAGHDCQPVVFSGSEAGWAFVGSLDDTSSGGGRSTAKAGSVGRLNSSAFNTFRKADTRGHAGGGDVSAGTELLTIHQNTITSVRPFEWGAGGTVSRVGTSGVDGKLVIWNVVPVSVAGVTGRLAGMRV